MVKPSDALSPHIPKMEMNGVDFVKQVSHNPREDARKSLPRLLMKKGTLSAGTSARPPALCSQASTALHLGVADVRQLLVNLNVAIRHIIPEHDRADAVILDADGHEADHLLLMTVVHVHVEETKLALQTHHNPNGMKMTDAKRITAETE